MSHCQRVYVTKASQAMARSALPVIPAARGPNSERGTGQPASVGGAAGGFDISRISIYPERLPRVEMHAPPVFLNLDDEAPRQTEEATGAQAVNESTGGGDEEAVPLQEKGKEEGKGKEQAAASCGETVSWQPDSPVPLDISADSPADFLTKANAALGNPHMNGAESHDLELTNGRVTKVNMTVTTSIVRPRWTGGRGMTDAEKELIRRMVEFIKTHEEKHRDAYRKVMQDAVCAALGKTGTAAQAAITKANCTDTPAAHEAIDASEGKLELVTDSSGRATDFKATGVTVSYKDKNCK
jgi:hypothetical protein